MLKNNIGVIMGRKTIPTHGIFGKLTVNRQIEFMIHFLGWNDTQIINAICSTNEGMADKKDELINHIRVAKFNIRSTENILMNKEQPVGTVTSLDLVQSREIGRFTSGIDNIDMLWGFSEDMSSKGFPRGQVRLLAGSPGVGKTRTMISVCGKITDPSFEKKINVLYWQNEFALEQFKTVSKGKIKENATFRCGDISSLAVQLEIIDKEKPDLVVVDSIQMLNEAKSRTGIERCMAAYKICAINNNLHIVLIGQLNKKEQVSGSRSTEHLVDSVYKAVVDRSSGGFSIICTKNRWGMSGIQCSFVHNADGVEPFGDIIKVEE